MPFFLEYCKTVETSAFIFNKIPIKLNPKKKLISKKINCFDCSDLIGLVKIQMSLYLLNILWTVMKLQEKNFLLFTDKLSIKKLIDLRLYVCISYIFWIQGKIILKLLKFCNNS